MNQRSIKRQRAKTAKKQFLTGIISVTRKGVGYVAHADFEEDIEIKPADLNTALNGDTVEVYVYPNIKGGRVAGEITRVLERSTNEFVGVLKRDKNRMLLVPDDKRMYTEIFISDAHDKAIDLSAQAEENMKALVKLSKWDNPKRDPEGTIIEIIGKKGDHNTEMRSIVLSHGFQTDFNKELEQEALEISKQKKIKDDEIKQRRDFREVTTFTIDPEDAKDFDDAISIKELPNEKVEVGIHIADVSHYVRVGSAIDKEARDRATSIYLVDRTIPMLPEILSNDVCSLNPNEDKLTYSAVFVLDNKGRVEKRWFGETIIHSDKRFTYEEAQKSINEKSGPFHTELARLNDISKKLREERFAKGSIDFDQDEVSFKLDKNGKPLSITKKQRIGTNLLIEDFMLLANREVATYFQKLCKKLPQSRATFLYRIHDVPDPEKIEELGIFLRAIGHDFKTKNKEVSAKELNKLFKKIEGTPEESLIKTATIRSMAKAIYSTKNIGHFGLSFTYYTHFTSPIRRYPDIMVHRILKSHLSNEPMSEKELLKYESLAIRSSKREVEAVAAERDSIKLKQVEYMKDHIGESFEGTVTGVVEWGIYVEEKNTKAEGLVRAASLKDDYYELDKKHYRLVGARSKKKYTLGDRVKIKLTAANLEDKNLEWALE